MKKYLLSTVAALTLAAMSSSAFASVELRMSWWGGNERHQATLGAIEKFQQKYPDIKVKSEYTGWDGHLTRLTTQIAGNTEPDVMQTNWNWMPIFSRDGKGFYDMSQQAQTLQLGEFAEKALGMATNAGKLNGIPVSMTSKVFYLNKHTWSQAGLSYPKSWDELLKAGPVFKEKLGASYFPVVLEPRDTFALARSYMIQKHNKDVISHESPKIAFNEVEMKEFFQLYVDLVSNHVIPSQKDFASYGVSNLFEMRPWINGEFGGLFMWDTAIDKYAEYLKPPLGLELAPYPMLAGATDSGVLIKPSMMFSMGRNTKNPEAAAKLINFLLNDAEGVKALGLTRGIPLSKKGMEVIKADGSLKQGNLAFDGYEQAQTLPQTIVATAYTDNAQLIELFTEGLQQLDYGKTTVDDVAKDFLRRGNRLMSRLDK
ncbi:oligogalacturonide-binding protein [Aeromonas sp. RU39B]|uniref:ABC transporter substrate-binding protein n=1 Tax=Aeromonas sp. RU39B TaxID=1907416 RepID=UPI000955A037|nr:ABC transporter substrate-binding protein [Aeromonas sp. RU39B]SIQ48730.1 oligogalacturonide-binding protein [Aeromonas sp. RU39B]